MRGVVGVRNSRYLQIRIITRIFFFLIIITAFLTQLFVITGQRFPLNLSWQARKAWKYTGVRKLLSVRPADSSTRVASSGGDSELLNFNNCSQSQQKKKTHTYTHTYTLQQARLSVRKHMQSILRFYSQVSFSRAEPQESGFWSKHGGRGNWQRTPTAGRQSSLLRPSGWRGNSLHVVTPVCIH